MANEYINIAHLYKRVPVLTDTNGDHLVAVSDLRTAIAMAAAETGEVHPMPCKIGQTVYMPWEWKGASGIASLTVKIVHMDIYFATIGTDLTSDDLEYLEKYNYGVFGFDDVGETVFLTREEAEAEKKRRDDP